MSRVVSVIIALLLLFFALQRIVLDDPSTVSLFDVLFEGHYRGSADGRSERISVGTGFFLLAISVFAAGITSSRIAAAITVFGGAAFFLRALLGVYWYWQFSLATRSDIVDTREGEIPLIVGFALTLAMLLAWIGITGVKRRQF